MSHPLISSTCARPSGRVRELARRAVRGPRRCGRDPLPAALVGLTAVTGMLDAISYLGLGRVFIAMMTGNVIFLGLALGKTVGPSGPGPALAIISFALGIVLAARTAKLATRRARQHWFFHAMAVEVALVAAATAVAALAPPTAATTRYVVIALLALAMGARCSTVRRLDVPDFPITVGLTGALIALVHESPLAGGGRARAERRLGVVLAMGVGATAGGFLMTSVGLSWSLLAVVGVLAAITLAVRVHPGGPATTGPNRPAPVSPGSVQRA
ncbi:YoaK family protein [Kitasatospora sp. NPDC008050]|uniref:YoaK family protein n=1 Tax=Kitasatospora sp. NPDC008050 TaxID=3364021 RepID=UPI0036E764DC